MMQPPLLRSIQHFSHRTRLCYSSMPFLSNVNSDLLIFLMIFLSKIYNVLKYTKQAYIKKIKQLFSPGGSIIICIFDVENKNIILIIIMSDLFTSYEQEFLGNLTNINKKIQSISVQTNQKKQLAFVDIKEDQKQCEKLIKYMQTQVNSLDVQIKFEYAKKVRVYKKDLDDCKKKLMRAQDDFAFEKNKEMLMGAQLDEQKSSAYRQKLLKQGEMTADVNFKLKDSVKLMHETEQIGHGVEIELTNQSQKMKANKERLLVMQDDIGSSEKKIKNIFMRIRKNKLTLIGSLSVVALIAIIAIIVHFSKK